MRRSLKKILAIIISLLSFYCFAQEGSVEEEYFTDSFYFILGETVIDYNLTQDQIELLDSKKQKDLEYFGIIEEKSPVDSIFVITLNVHTVAEEFYKKNNYSYVLRIVYNIKTHSGRLFLYTSAPIANIDDHVYNAMRVFKKFNFERLNKEYCIVRYEEPIRRAGYYILEFNCSKY